MTKIWFQWNVVFIRNCDHPVTMQFIVNIDCAIGILNINVCSGHCLLTFGSLVMFHTINSWINTQYQRWFTFCEETAHLVATTILNPVILRDFARFTKARVKREFHSEKHIYTRSSRRLPVQKSDRFMNAHPLVQFVRLSEMRYSYAGTYKQWIYLYITFGTIGHNYGLDDTDSAVFAPRSFLENMCRLEEHFRFDDVTEL